MSSTAVIVIVFSPLIKFIVEEKFPVLSAVVMMSSLSVMIARFEFGEAVPLSVIWESVTTELFCGIVTEILLSCCLVGVGVVCSLFSSDLFASGFVLDELLARLMP